MNDKFDYDVITSAPGNTANNNYTSPSETTLPSLEVISAVNTIATHALSGRRIEYKYCEDKIIADFNDYIDKTYGQHYKTTTHKIECFDAWLAMGDATPTFRNTAIKYLWRYGKKNSYVESKNDLFKALHYVLMCLYNDHYRKK